MRAVPTACGALMRNEPAHGAMDVGHVTFSPMLQRTPAATEAQFLLTQLAFDTLGDRRHEWKCDSLNAPLCHATPRRGPSRLQA